MRDVSGIDQNKREAIQIVRIVSTVSMSGWQGRGVEQGPGALGARKALEIRAVKPEAESGFATKRRTRLGSVQHTGSMGPEYND